MSISPARSAAFEILRLVEQGGYATDLLVSRTAEFDSRDAGLAEEIVLGSLRFQAQLDFLIRHFSGRPATRLDTEVRIALRMGIYQMRYLTRVPPHAAVGESAELVKRARKRSAIGFVNAVLRKVHRQPVAWPDRATELSHPAWMLERWDRQCGPEATEKMARANLVPPETYVRVPGPVPSGLELEPTEVPGCYRKRGQTPFPSSRRKRLSDPFFIQDIGSQSIVPLLELEPGQTFLDVSAAPGNKTAQALESGVRAVACDINFRRLAAMRELGCDLVVMDGTQNLPFNRRFNRILLDAPCSGTGTLARNPEIKWRLRPEDFPALHERQSRMLRNALERLAPGGRLVYSTCSLEREENEDIVNEAPARVLRLWRRLPGVNPGDGFFAAVITSE